MGTAISFRGLDAVIRYGMEQDASGDPGAILTVAGTGKSVPAVTRLGVENAKRSRKVIICPARGADDREIGPRVVALFIRTEDRDGAFILRRVDRQQVRIAVARAQIQIRVFRHGLELAHQPLAGFGILDLRGIRRVRVRRYGGGRRRRLRRRRGYGRRRDGRRLGLLSRLRRVGLIGIGGIRSIRLGDIRRHGSGLRDLLGRIDIGLRRLTRRQNVRRHG